MSSIIPTSIVPEFPNFAPLSLAQAEIIQTFSKQYPPYSDFLFSNLWAWDLDHSSEVCILKNNLVYKLRDYEEDLQFFTFLGESQTEQTAIQLLDYAGSIGMHEELLYMPEISVTKFQDYHIKLYEDRNNYDYILDAKLLASPTASEFSKYRNMLSRFNRNNLNSVKVEVSTLSNCKVDLGDFCERWRIMRNKELSEIEDELLAMNRVIDAAEKLNLQIMLVKIQGELAGFTIFEIVGDTGIIHFDKALTSFVGIYEFMKQQLAEKLVILGVDKINYEQDLGIEGLRRAKESYHPIEMLKKYKVRKTAQ